MRGWWSGLAMSLLVGTALAQGTAAPAADVIAQRRDGLKRMGAHVEAMKPVADSRGDPTAQAARVDDMLAWFSNFPTRFPAGSDVGDTKARPEVWSDRAGFERANANMLERLQALRTVAVAGDAAAFQSQFGTLGQQGCGGCHRPYRAR